MKFESFAVGDTFINDTNGQLTVTSLRCEYNQTENRWETLVGTSFVYDGGETVEETTKAWVFVKVINDASFHSRIMGNGVLPTAATSSSAPPQSPIAEDFIRTASRYGLDPSDLGKTIRISSGKRVKIIGAKPRNHKYPILVEGSQGGRWKISATSAKQALLKAATP